MATVEFRTGPREIPDHLADMMAELKTQAMTYEEAVAAANKRMQRITIDKAVDRHLQAHFQNHGMLR